MTAISEMMYEITILANGSHVLTPMVGVAVILRPDGSLHIMSTPFEEVKRLYSNLPPVLAKIVVGYLPDAIGLDEKEDYHEVFYDTLEDIGNMIEIRTIKPLTITATNKRAFARQIWGEVRLVGDMSGMFANTDFNGDLSHWDVSQVTDMNHMFAHAVAFNGDISRWDVSQVTRMNSMFNGAELFNGDISKWNVGRVRYMDWMFTYAYSFNGDVSHWDVSQVTSMDFMFAYTGFNGDVSRWQVGRVDNMWKMFCGTPFNGDVSQWDVREVKCLKHMFYGTPFNGDVSQWQIGSVEYGMHGIFKNCPKSANLPAWYREEELIDVGDDYP